MSMPGEVTQEQLTALAGGDSSASVGGEVTPDNNANIPNENVPQEPAAPSTSNDDFLSADSVYADLPTAFREGKMLDKVIADVNARHQKALSEVSDKWAPYEPFLKAQPEELGYAYQVFQMMDTPEGAQKVFNALVNTYGFTTGQAAQAVGELQQQGQQDQQQTPEVPDEDLTPEQLEIKQLKQQMSELTQFRQSQEQMVQQQVMAEQERIFGNDLDAAMRKVYEADPSLANDEIRNDQLLTSIMFEVDKSLKAGGNKSIDKIVLEAHAAQRAYNQHLYDTLRNQQGQGPTNQPLIMNPTGSNPGGNRTFDPKDEKARDQEMIRRLEELKHLS